MAEKKIRVGQFGVGYWGPNLLRNLLANPQIEVAAVVDLSKSRTDYVEKNFPGVNVSQDPAVILENPDVDAVVIATPVSTHCQIALAALRNGKHILVEKPMAQTVKEIEQIALVAAEKNLVAMVGHTFLFSSPVRYLKQLIDAGELGQIRYIYSQRLNLGRIRQDVDALWNFAPHDVSIIQYLFGNPTPLTTTRCGLDYVQRGIDDVVFLNIVYPNRVIANIHVSWLDPQRVRTMVLVGSDKMAVYDDAAEKKIAIYDKGIDRFAVLGENMDYDRQKNFQFTHRSGNVVYPELTYTEPLSNEVAHFADCILNGTECVTNPFHALSVVKILASAERIPPTPSR